MIVLMTMVTAMLLRNDDDDDDGVKEHYIVSPKPFFCIIDFSPLLVSFSGDGLGYSGYLLPIFALPLPIPHSKSRSSNLPGLGA